MAIDGADSIERVAAWMDWRAKQGLEDPSPVTFLGGIKDMPAGSHGFFTADLPPGNYALLAEIAKTTVSLAMSQASTQVAITAGT